MKDNFYQVFWLLCRVLQNLCKLIVLKIKKHSLIVRVNEKCVYISRLTPYLLWYFKFSFNYKALFYHEYYKCIYLVTLVPSISFLSHIFRLWILQVRCWKINMKNFRKCMTSFLYSFSPAVVAGLWRHQDEGKVGSQFPDLGGIPEKRHETCQNRKC